MKEVMKSFVENMEVYTDCFKVIATLLPIVWALFIYSEWKLLREYYRQFGVEQWFRPSYRIAVDPRYLVSFINTLLVWIIAQILAFLLLYRWWTGVSVGGAIVSMLVVYWAEKQHVGILEKRLFRYYKGMLSHKDITEYKVRGKFPATLTTPHIILSRGERVYRRLFSGFLRKDIWVESLDSLTEMERKWITGEYREYEDPLLNYGIDFASVCGGYTRTRKKVLRTVTVIQTFIITLALFLMSTYILGDDAYAWRLLSFLILCPLWHKYIFLRDTNGLREVLEYGRCYPVGFQWLRLIYEDGKNYALVSPNSFDANQSCIAVRTEIFKRRESLACAYLFPYECKALPSPFNGQTQSVYVSFIELGHPKYLPEPLPSKPFLVSSWDWYDVEKSFYFKNGDWAQCKDLFEQYNKEYHDYIDMKIQKEMQEHNTKERKKEPNEN